MTTRALNIKSAGEMPKHLVLAEDLDFIHRSLLDSSQPSVTSDPVVLTPSSSIHTRHAGGTQKYMQETLIRIKQICVFKNHLKY